MINKKSLLNRTLVGLGIFALMLGMVLLDVYVPARLFEDTPFHFMSGRAINSFLLCVIIFLAVVEMRRAFGVDRIPDCFSWLLWAYGIGVGASYCFFGYPGIIFITMLVFIGAAITSLYAKRADSLVYVSFTLVYPGMFLAALLYINRAASTRIYDATNIMYQFVEYDIWKYFTFAKVRTSQLLPYNAIGLAFVFAVSSFTDVFAYFVGSLFGKHKLAPEISPKKTVEGAIGGILGGIFGSFLVFFVFDWLKIFGDHYGLTFEGLGLNSFGVACIYIIVGLLGSVATQIGDLLASHVKRFCGIKDFSHILGEHGGIMDRFDGIMMNAVLVAVVFMFIL